MEPGPPTRPIPPAEPLGGAGRVAALMDAVVSVSSELEIATVLERLVAAACRVTGARYGALGVPGEHGGLEEFVTHGIDADTRRQISVLPVGRGVLGRLFDVPGVLRLADLRHDPSSVGFPPHHPPMRTFLGLPVRVSGRVYGNLYLADKCAPDGAVIEFTDQDEESMLILASAAGVAVEHARAYHLAHQHERWLEAAAACTAALTGEVPLELAITEVLDRAQDAAGATGAAMCTHEGDLPTGEAGSALQGAGPSVLAGDGLAVGLRGPVWLLAVPLRSGDRWIGGVLLGWQRDGGRTAPQVDLAMVAGFGDQLALALDVAAAQADRARLAVLEERERIARDLHDMVIQRLFAIGLSVQAIAQDPVREDVSRRLDVAVDELDETIKDIRAAIFRLGARSSSLGFRHQIDAEVVQSRAHLGFLPRLRTDGVTAVVPRDVGQDAVAVVREALANTSRHARARSAIVKVSVGYELVVEVQDDGIGLPDDVTRRSGLANMQERAARHGGSLQVAGVAGGGTIVCWRVPLAR
jgi:signal transduction histidine kinase